MAAASAISDVPFDPIRLACVEIIGNVLDQGRKTDLAIQDFISSGSFSDRDIRFIRQMCHGVVKMKRRLDHSYGRFLAKPRGRLDPVTRNILRLGMYQLLFTDRIPAGAAVSESVNLAVKTGNKRRGAFVNGVLRTFLREPHRVTFPDLNTHPHAYLSVFYSYPDWYVGYCLKEFGFKKTEALLDRGNQTPSVTYRLNRLRFNPMQLTELLESHNIAYRNGKFLEEFYHIDEPGLPLETELIDKGRVYVQDEAAGLAIRLLNPKQRDKIIDLAAAPGGKATYAASRMHNQGSIIAVDVSAKRLDTLMANARRLGVHIITPVTADMLAYNDDTSNRILLDLPCSGWGVVARNSDLRWSKSEDDSRKLAELQAKMIRHAADLVRPGGVTVYSTCTTIRQENELVIEAFLKDRPDFTVEPADKFVPSEIVTAEGYVKTYPDQLELDGAFCVRLKKNLGSK